MIMRDKEEVAKLIREVFDAYCKSFDDSLNRLKIWPWTDKKTVIHESNQIHRFLDAYQKTGSNIVTWMELPVYQKNCSLEPKVTHMLMMTANSFFSLKQRDSRSLVRWKA